MALNETMAKHIRDYIDAEASKKKAQADMDRLIELMTAEAEKYGITVYQDCPLATFSIVPERTDITVDSDKVKKIENWETLYGKERYTKSHGKVSRKTKGTERQARANG